VTGLDFQQPLRAIRMTSPDIRAGVSLLIAALSANGTSTIDNIEQIQPRLPAHRHPLERLGGPDREDRLTGSRARHAFGKSPPHLHPTFAP
jgi:hypothetical protein